jgi:ferrous iron transport protein A
MWRRIRPPVPPGVFPLAMARAQQPLQCVAVRAGRGVWRHLAAMGLVPGAVITVLNSRGPGSPLMIRIGDTRLALGWGMAQRVMVRPLEP